jgi:copper transport protein
MTAVFRRLLIWALLAVGIAPLATAGEGDFFTHLHTDKAMANVTVSPARAGPVDIAIQLETVQEKPLPAKAVTVTLTNSRSKAKSLTVGAERLSEDKWLAKVTLPAAGRWTLGLNVSISDTDKVSVEAPIVIK